MTPKDIALVRTRSAKVAPMPPAAAARCRARSFGIAPETRAPFSGDLRAHGWKPTAMLATVVGSLDRLDVLVLVPVPAAEALARRHAGHGVVASQDAPVAQAPIDTRDWGRGDAFPEATPMASTTADDTLSAVTIDAGHPKAA